MGENLTVIYYQTEVCLKWFWRNVFWTQAKVVFTCVSSSRSVYVAQTHHIQSCQLPWTPCHLQLKWTDLQSVYTYRAMKSIVFRSWICWMPACMCKHIHLHRGIEINRNHLVCWYFGFSLIELWGRLRPPVTLHGISCITDIIKSIIIIQQAIPHIPTCWPTFSAKNNRAESAQTT